MRWKGEHPPSPTLRPLRGRVGVAPGIDESVRTLHPPPRHDSSGHGRDPDVRLDGLPEAAGGAASERGLPDDSGARGTAGRQPRNHGRGGRHAAREAVFHHRRAGADDLFQHPGHHPGHLAVRARSRHRRRGAGRADRHLARAPSAAAGHERAAVLSQGQSCGPADLLSRAHLADAAPVQGERIRRDAHGAAHFHDQRRRPGAGVRVASLCRARSSQPAGARRARHRHRRGGAGAGPAQPQPAHGHAAGRAHLGLGDDQRAAAERGRFPRRHRCLPQRRAGPGQGHRPSHRRRAEQPHGGLVQRPARDPAGHSASARHQHGRGGQRDPQAAAPVPGSGAAGRRDRRPLRPLPGNPRVGARRAVHPDARAGAGGDGHLPVPAQPVGHGHPGSRVADVDHRHLRRDVCVRVQHRHAVADGADAVRGVRGGRRDRDAGKHRAPPGDGQDTAAGHARRLPRDRLHHPVDDAVARRWCSFRSCSWRA